MRKVRKHSSKIRIRDYSVYLLTISFLVFVGTVFMILPAFAELSIKANHNHIEINFFYNGSTVSVSGESDQDTDLVIKIASPEGHQMLRKKGKAAGFLWMNVGKITFKHSPNVYFLHSTKKLEDMLSSEEADKYMIGYRSLMNHIDINAVDNEKEKKQWFNEFIKFKENSRLYDVGAGNIKLAEEKGRQNYYTLIDWPYQAPPGDYIVNVYAVKDGRVVDHAETKVLVEQVGIVKMLYRMAKNKGALYGIISIFAALGAGFGVGMIFRKGGGAH